MLSFSSSDDDNSAEFDLNSSYLTGVSYTLQDQTSTSRPVNLRSQCRRHACPCGKGITFNSRISPSPSQRKHRRLKKNLNLTHDVTPQTDCNLTLPNMHDERKLRNRIINMETPQSSTSKPKNYRFQKTKRKERSKSKEFSFILDSRPAQGTPKSPRSHVSFASYIERCGTEDSLSGYSSENDTTQKVLESSFQLRMAKSRNPYIAYSSDEELEDWQNQPKTDYTYSRSLSYRDSVTPGRYIGPPNMSRPHLKGNTPPSYYNTSEHSRDASYASTSSQQIGAGVLELRNRGVGKNAIQYSSDSSIDDEFTKKTSASKSYLSSNNIHRETIQTKNSKLTSYDTGSDYLQSIGVPVVASVQSSGQFKSNGNITYVKTEARSRVITTRSITRNGCNGHTKTSHQSIDTQSNLLQKWWWSLIIMATTIITTIANHIVDSKDYISNKLSSVSTRMKDAIFKRNRRSRFEVNTTIVTTATWLRQRISTSTSETLSWYAEKRRKNSCIWFWIPLLLLLLLPLLTYWWQSSDQDTDISLLKNPLVYCSASINSAIHGSWLYAKNFYTYFYGMLPFSENSKQSYLLSIQTFLWNTVLVICDTVCDTFKYLVWCFVWVASTLWQFGTLIVSHFSDIIQYLWFSSVFWIKETTRALSNLNVQRNDVETTPVLTSSDITQNQILHDFIASKEFKTYITEKLDQQKSLIQQQKHDARARYLEEIEKLKVELSQNVKRKEFEDIFAQLLLFEKNQMDFTTQYQKISILLENVVKDMKDQTQESEKIANQYQEFQRKLKEMKSEMSDLTAKLEVDKSTLMEEIKKCCQKSLNLPDEIHVQTTEFFTSLLGLSIDDGSPLTIESLKQSLSEFFVNKEQLKSELESLSCKITQGIKTDNEVSPEKLKEWINTEILQKFKQRHVELYGQTDNYDENLSSKQILFNVTEVELIVHRLIEKYDADKTGMTDYALESSGGSIVSTRCSENYDRLYANVLFWGFPVYSYSLNSPRSIIQPLRDPGQCWAFKGTQGHVVIKLVTPIQITGFTLEHLPKSLSPKGNIESAPKNITVYGLHDENSEGDHLGSYQYLDNNVVLQYFPVSNISDTYYSHVLLKIISNHGNIVYTCVYRFRVHGNR